ncbi:hypothetical protein L0Y65_04745 [Candidatus Micrarchaeota archaeon]|nr:hypothetical protein [Candidatus Micrarchaeota archaeon]
MEEILAAAVFPLILFAGGAYLVYRGVRRRAGPTDSVTGAVGCSEPIESPIGKRKCVYSRVVVEYYQRGTTPWKEVYSYESQAMFKIDDRPVDPTHASFSLSPPDRFEGYVRPKPGLFDSIGPRIRQFRAIADVTSEISPAEIMDESALRAVLSLPGAKEKLKTYLNGALRISEHCLQVGAEATVVLDPAAPRSDKISGTLDYPLEINVHGQRGAMNAKALASMALGAFLILLSSAVFLLLLS